MEGCHQLIALVLGDEAEEREGKGQGGSDVKGTELSSEWIIPWISI